MSLNNSYNCSNTPPQVHNFIPMSSGIPTSHPHHSTQEGKQEDEAAKFSPFIELQKNHVERFWNQQLLEIQNTTVSRSDHRLPLARVKRIMKSDAGVKMVSSETPILFSKACELFIMELTLRAWLHTEGSKRRTLQRCDIARAIRSDQLLYDFLASLVLCSEYQDDYFHCKKEEEGNSTKTNQDSTQLPPNSTTADATTGVVCLPLTNQDVAELEQVIKLIVNPNSSSLMSSSSREFPSK